MGGLIRFVKERAGLEISPMLGGEFYAQVGKIIGHEKAYELKHIFRETGIESQGLEPIDKAAWYLEKAKEDGAYILLMTARPYKKYKRIMADTIGWLKRYGFRYDAILFDENKEERIIKEYAFARYVVEDTLDNALRIAAKGIAVYLRDLSYNQGPVDDLPIFRFKDYEELKRMTDYG
jgi:hypothetical protein